MALLKIELMKQSEKYCNTTPIQGKIIISTNFLRYSINETKKEIKNKQIEQSRVALLERVMEVK